MSASCRSPCLQDSLCRSSAAARHRSCERVRCAPRPGRAARPSQARRGSRAVAPGQSLPTAARIEFEHLQRRRPASSDQDGTAFSLLTAPGVRLPPLTRTWFMNQPNSQRLRHGQFCNATFTRPHVDRNAERGRSYLTGIRRHKQRVVPTSTTRERHREGSI
jgi:hypothetical protein